jgi:hypothetical protein
LSVELLEQRTTVSDVLLGVTWLSLVETSPYEFWATLSHDTSAQRGLQNTVEQMSLSLPGAAADDPGQIDRSQLASRSGGADRAVVQSPPQSFPRSTDRADESSFIATGGLSRSRRVSPAVANFSMAVAVAAAPTNMGPAGRASPMAPAPSVFSSGGLRSTAEAIPILPPTTGPLRRDPGFQVSWQAGAYDPSGQYMGGVELMSLVGHEGELFAATSQWKDIPNNTDPVVGAQILRLDAPDGQWQVDHTFDGFLPDGTLRYQRVDALSEVTFTTDGQGQPLPEPVKLLLAAPTDGTGDVPVFSRDDSTGTWTEMVLTHADAGSQVRSLGFHHDPVTGVDRVFAGGEGIGTYSGVYDPSVPGNILWDAQPEQVYDTRAMAFTEANGVLLMANSPQLSGRIDGPDTSWQQLLTYPPPVEGAAGLRGLTAIPSVSGDGQDVLAGFEDLNSRMVRINPADGYHYVVELNVKQFLRHQWGSLGFPYAVPAFNDIPAVTDPQTGQAVHLVSLEAFAPGINQRTSSWYLTRQADQTYDLHEIPSLANPFTDHPYLEGTRTIVVSPFADDAGQMVYFGGYDASFAPGHNTAWIYRAPLDTVLGETS